MDAPAVTSEAGYWTQLGAPASVDWCEPNYVVTHYVAEWWNTLSSVPLVLLGLYGLWRCWGARHELEARFAAAFFSMAIVGLGSTAFHGTLLHVAQAADELPMIYGSLVLLYCLINRRFGPSRRTRAWALGFTAYAVLFTVAYFTLKAYFTLFIVSYGGLVGFLVLGSWRVAVGDTGSQMHRSILKWAAGAYLGGVFLLWFPEHVFFACDHPIQSVHLHSGWHLAAGLGTYLGILFAMWDRLSLQGRDPQLERGRLLPFVVPAP